MTGNRCVAVALVFGSLLCLARCDNSFAPDVDLPLSPEAAAERVRVVREFYQTALENEQNTPLKLRTGTFKIMDDSSNVSGGLDDSMIVAVLAKMVRQYPPDWENAET